MKKRLSLLIIYITLTVGSMNAFEWQNGDLIFRQPCNKQGVSEAIQNVTQSASKYQFTHVGMVYIPRKYPRKVYVIEATQPCVQMVPLEQFMQDEGTSNCRPICVAARLKPPYRKHIPKAIKFARRLIGREYDYGFVLNNGKYYCSELIYEVLRKARGKEVFPLNVMTFKAEGQTHFLPEWERYFSDKKLPIPEGEMGINPGAMSRSSVIDLLGEV